MKYKNIDLNSYKLHLINTDKFKTITVKISFRCPIKKDEITLRNVLCNMFMQSSKNYKNKRELTIKAQDLYAADIQTTNTRLGSYINTDYFLSVLNDKYTESGNFKDALEFFSDIIFNPDVEDEKFNEEKLDIVKENVKNALTSIKENTSNYSLIRMFEEFNDKSIASYRMMGYLEDLDNINGKTLYEHYKKMINTNLIDIFVIGNFDEDEMTKLIQENFKFDVFKKRDVKYLLDETKPRSKKLQVKEQIESSQSKLAIACCLNNLTDYERAYPLALFNVIYGGGSDSKLFKIVREKNSLCYTIGSVPNKLDNLLLIRAGIDKDNYEKSIKLIEKCLDDMKKGNFDEQDINTAKEFFNTVLEELEESETKIINNYYMMELIGTDPIDVKREKMNKVTKEEIINVAKKVTIDTVFLLEGIKDERN